MIKNFEYLLFKRFFFSKKNEGYISIISWFSLVGISLGVAVLIIVMSVAICGILFFLHVKKLLKKKLNYHLSQKNKIK